MLVKAISKGIKISPRKVSVVASLVRGRSVKDALVILEHTPRRAAIDVAKTIKSAVANADNNHNVRPDSLVISEIYVTPGPRLKRFRPVARGSAHPFQHKTSHLRVVVDGEVRVPKKKAEAEDKTKKAKETK
jgi:large subunit ribosomal protein L22